MCILEMCGQQQILSGGGAVSALQVDRVWALLGTACRGGVGVGEQGREGEECW